MFKPCFTIYKSIISSFIALSFTFSSIFPTTSYAQSVLNLPAPGTMVSPSAAFVPVMLMGMTIHPEDPFKFDFIVDSGNTGYSSEEVKEESEKLVKYFLASMTIPKDDLWVNLSPYEKDQIIPDELGKTELGRDMLAQDYLLKQLTATLMYPEENLGKDFWARVHKKAQEQFGTTEIPVNTFNKVWIIPENASVYEKNQTVYIVRSRLKVLLEQDYLALGNNKQSTAIGTDQLTDSEVNEASALSSQIVREIIIPEIEREVNEGKNFAPLRQIFHALILAKWYKETIKDSLLAQAYVDQNKISGVHVDDETIKEKIYAQYIQAYTKGVFDYIKEDYDQLSQEVIPRKYFSGGVVGDVNVVPVASGASIPASVGPTSTVAVRVDRVLTGNNNGIVSYGKSMTVAERSTLQSAEATEEFDAQRNDAMVFTGAAVIPAIYLVGSETDPETFGAVYSSTEERVYLQRSFVKRIKDTGDHAGMSARLFVRLLTAGSERDKLKAEYEYAKAKFPKIVSGLLPQSRAQGKNFDDVIKRVRESILALDLDENRLRSELQLGDDIVFHKDAALIEEHAKVFLDVGENALYKIAINALNKKIDLQKNFRLSATEATPTSPQVRAGMLAFAANPITQAHYLIATLKAMAETEVDTFFVSPTKGDFRKPALEATYDKRLDMARKFYDEFTGGLIRVMPALPEEMGDGNGVNGEEKILPLLKLNGGPDNVSLLYGAGADHFFAFAKEKDGSIKMGKIDTGKKGNKKDFEYYVKLLAYPQLLKDLIETDEASVPSSYRAFVKKLSEAADPAERVAMLTDGAFFPVLDTVGKLFLLQKEIHLHPDLGDVNADLRKILTSRGEMPVDLFRETLNFPVSYNSGVDFDIAATLARNGIAKLFRDGVFDLTLFEVLPKDLLIEIFKPENREYLFSLVRVKGIKFEDAYEFSNSVDILFPADPQAEDARHDGLVAGLKERLEKIFPGSAVQVREARDKSKAISVITVLRDGQNFLQYFYSVKNGISEKAGGDNTFLVKDIKPDALADTALTAQAIAAVEDYINVYNTAKKWTLSGSLPALPVVVAASVAAQPAEAPGGIDFNNIDVTREGDSEIEIEFNAATIEFLFQGEIQGLKPVIINVIPLPSVLPLLGLEPIKAEGLYEVSSIK